MQSPIQRLLLSKNTATINGSDFTEKTAEATVTYDEQSEYKRFKGYDPETKRASWEISVTLDKDQARVLDQTYSGTDPEKALHFFVPETLVITDKDGNPIPSEDWSFDGTEQQNKEGKSYALASRLPKLATTRSNTTPSCMNRF